MFDFLHRVPIALALLGAGTAVMADSKLRERLAKLDVAPEYAPGSALQAKLQSEIRNWSACVDEKRTKAE